MPALPIRRRWLLAAGLATCIPGAYALPPRALSFPRDHGSHPLLRTEWWYITGQLRAAGTLWGFQITFFRSRVDVARSLRSAFAARQLLFAHAALTDVAGKRLRHDQRIARAGFGVAQASETDTDIRLNDWRLQRQPSSTPGDSRYTIHAQAQDFALALTATSTQPILLQGDHGLSRKGPLPENTSCYASQPQLALSGHIQVGAKQLPVQTGAPQDNRAWMDHEWSEALMHPDAVGWDWIGINLTDGGALTAFVLRRADGSPLWAGGSLRAGAHAPVQAFDHDTVRFTPLRHWTSPATGTRYPVQQQMACPAGRFTITAMVDDQELDSRASTGAIYWEGLSTLTDAQGREVGRGYLELTGYAQRLRLD
ncbi:lipocalin-like domain-containing protein [Comamonas badia]|uniref:lipocalin-like domain-containing protein n=1 Tax=Comamonas badia TaxID=265291 RepID=UPI000466CD44|nr:carotenoid 1,2-hydratase [Comamonas badia]